MLSFPRPEPSGVGISKNSQKPFEIPVSTGMTIQKPISFDINQFKTTFRP